jgi:hypothetical protein
VRCSAMLFLFSGFQVAQVSLWSPESLIGRAMMTMLTCRRKAGELTDKLEEVGMIRSA